jgi:hypothetical protein
MAVSPLVETDQQPAGTQIVMVCFGVTDWPRTMYM